MTKILLVGGNGYIGRGIRKTLEESHGADTRVLDLPANLFSLTVQDVRAVDAVFNLAVKVEPELSSGLGHASASWQTTVEGTVHLLRLCEMVDIPMIQFSTREVHSLTLDPADVVYDGANLRPLRLVPEDVPYSPRSAYGRSKLVAEWLCSASPVGYSLRLGTPYSDETPESGGGLITSIVRKSVMSGVIQLDGGGRQFRDPLHVKDLTCLAVQVVTQRPNTSVFNAACGGENVISLREIALLANPKVEIVTTLGGDLGFAMDVSRSREVLGWNPTVQVRNKIPLYAEAYARQMTEIR